MTNLRGRKLAWAACSNKKKEQKKQINQHDLDCRLRKDDDDTAAHPTKATGKLVAFGVDGITA